MTNLNLEKEITALLVIDPYSDFISEGGKLSDRLLGYDVTMVKDALPDYSDNVMHAAVDTNIPNYAIVVVTTDEFVESIAFLYM